MALLSCGGSPLIVMDMAMACHVRLGSFWKMTMTQSTGKFSIIPLWHFHSGNIFLQCCLLLPGWKYNPFEYTVVQMKKILFVVFFWCFCEHKLNWLTKVKELNRRSCSKVYCVILKAYRKFAGSFMWINAILFRTHIKSSSFPLYPYATLSLTRLFKSSWKCHVYTVKYNV